MTDQFRPLKDAFGRFTTGIGVVSCVKEDGGYALLTINSFASVSLSPSLVLWCIEQRASAFPAFMAADSYAVSILRADQRDLSDRFAGYDYEAPKDSEIDIATTGAPLLKGRLAGFDCTVSARHKAGDHVIMLGEVVHFDSSPGEPLVYFSSDYHEGLGKP